MHQASYHPGEEPAPATDMMAHIKVWVPAANADVWLNGSRTKQTGTYRQFKSPTLEPGQAYAYEIRARWTEDGHTVEQTRTIKVHANDLVKVDLTKPALATVSK
jgi:uncharacterized protein (TIGR03000 family)